MSPSIARAHSIRASLVALLVVLLVGHPALVPSARAAHVDLDADTVVATDALTFVSGTYGVYPNGVSFQQDAVTSFAGYQYAGYYDDDRHVCIARRALASTTWQPACFTDYTATTSDTHNVVSLGISPLDGTIHVAFDHHVSALHYRVSSTGVATSPATHTWSTALFGAVTDRLVAGVAETSVSYPRFLVSPDGDLALIRRSGGSGNGSSILYRYDAGTHTWTKPGTFIAASGSYPGGDGNRSPYLDYPQYDATGRLHLTWMWRETTDAGSNHDLNYAYSDDDGSTWRNGAGALVATTGTTPMSVSTTGIRFATIGVNRGLLNQQSSFVDGAGVVHVMTQHAPASFPATTDGAAALAARVYHHYWRTTDGTWHVQELGFSGSRPKLVVADGGDAYLVYRTGTTLAIARGSAAAGYGDWQQIQTLPGTWGGEPLLDVPRWRSTGVLSIFLQEAQVSPGAASALHVLDVSVQPGSPLTPPVAEWRFDETGGVAEDEAPGAHDGTLVNGVSRVPGVRGTALQFDGVDDYVQVPDAADLDGMPGLSVSAWVRLDDLPVQTYVPVGKDASSAQASYRLTVNSSGIAAFAVKTASNGWYTTGTTAAGGLIDAGVWHHLVGTYDGSTVRIYLDGVLVGTGVASISGAIATGTSPVRFGAASFANIDPYDGALDDVQIFDSALSATEISAFFASY